MLASELLEEIRDQGNLTPDSTDATLLRAADAEIRTRLLPLLRTVNEEYLVRHIDIAAVNGRVALPPRATGAAVRMVQVVSGGQLSAPLPRLDPALDTGSGVAAAGQPAGFYFDGGSIVLVPLSSTATIRVRYYARPGKLVLESDGTSCGVITAVSVGATTTTLTAAAFSGSFIGIDVIASGPAHQHKAIDGINPMPNTSIFEAIIAGDYVARADFSPFVALPEELGSTLALRAAARVLFGLGYRAEAKDTFELAETAQADAMAMLRPRSDGNPKRLSGGTLSAMAYPGISDGWRGGW